MYDAIIVGARCAGSPTAMLLARQGHKVLLLDKAHFPSDIMSTHYLQPDAVARLEKWGLLDKVAASNCPPIPKVTMHLDGFAMTPPALPGQPQVAYCPRRTVLDKILVDAAVEAGAELREGFSVRELIFEGDRVVGLRGRDESGADVEERATIVVGADGMRSMVAQAVHAEAYDEHPTATCGYYNYFSGVEMEGAELYAGSNGGVLAFPTNDGLVCIAVGRSVDQFADYKKDIAGNFHRYLDEVDPVFGAKVRAGKAEERWIGSADHPNFFRKPWGAGWALVGDAGYHKDPVTGLGIMDAFRDADLLADAIHAGLAKAGPMEEALASYQEQRDAAAKPMYDFTLAFATGVIPPEIAGLIEAAKTAQAAEAVQPA
jgi:flavin-dependent dehydrogenase